MDNRQMANVLTAVTQGLDEAESEIRRILGHRKDYILNLIAESSLRPAGGADPADEPLDCDLVEELV